MRNAEACATTRIAFISPSCFSRKVEVAAVSRPTSICARLSVTTSRSWPWEGTSSSPISRTKVRVAATMVAEAGAELSADISPKHWPAPSVATWTAPGVFGSPFQTASEPSSIRKTRLLTWFSRMRISPGS